MATNNDINTGKPIEVSNGGTGAATLTNHGILVGSGTAAITALGVGVTGTLLGGLTGADPAFTSSSDGNFTFTSATAGTNRILTVSNTDNTNVASAATVQITTGGASAGDATIKWSVTGATDYSMGIDNSDSDKLKISNSTALGTTDTWIMTSAGERTMPFQPAFLAINSTSINNLIGDGTERTVTWNTEVFDQNSDFASPSFTAPITARYNLESSLLFGGITAAYTVGFTRLITSNRSYFNQCNLAAMRDLTNNTCSMSIACLADMDAADTVYVTVMAGGGANVIDILSNGTSDPQSWFSGSLEC